MRLDQSLLDEAERALGTECETEAVTRALRRVVDDARVAEGNHSPGGPHMLDESRIIA